MGGRRVMWLRFLQAVPVLGWMTGVLGRRLLDGTVSSFIVSYFSSILYNLSPISHSFLTCSPSPRTPINPSFCKEILYMWYCLRLELSPCRRVWWQWAYCSNCCPSTVGGVFMQAGWRRAVQHGEGLGCQLSIVRQLCVLISCQLSIVCTY